MLAKGFVSGKDAINRAKSFDKFHQLSDKLSIGTTIIYS